MRAWYESSLPYDQLLERSIRQKIRFLNPYPWIFGTNTERVFWKKSKTIAGDFPVGTKKMKTICADRMSVGLSDDANFKWHMPICVDAVLNKNTIYLLGIYYFWDRHRPRFPEKKIPKHWNIYKSSQCCTLDFFSAKHARVLDFFQDSRITLHLCKQIFVWKFTYKTQWFANLVLFS